jgi:hypothetical protein
LYSSLYIIRLIKSRRSRWAKHDTRNGGKVMHVRVWCGSQKEKGHQEDMDVNGRIVLKLNLVK